MQTSISRAAFWALSGLSCVAFAPTGAATEPHESLTELAPVVVTAQRGPQALADTILQTTLFDRQDIDDSGAFDLPGLLMLAPGAQVVRNGGPGGSVSLFLRGAQPTQSLVLIDGVRVDSASLGQAQLGQLPLEQIERVEVVSGNVSALYGSGAVGGVVQVFTKDGGNHPPRFTASASYGRYHTQTQQAGVSGRLDEEGKTRFNLSLARFKSSGFSALNPRLAPHANPDANGYLNESVSASLRRVWNDWEVGVTYFQANGTASYDSAWGEPTDLNHLRSKVQQISGYANGKLTPWWESRLTVATGNDRSSSQLNGTDTGRFDTDNRQYTWQNDITVAPGQKIQAGYEHLVQRLDASAYAAPRRNVDLGWLGYIGQYGRNQLQLNVRRDQYSDFGGANSYLFGYAFDLTKRWKLTGNYAAAFRAPTFNDLYYPDSGSLSILPERSHSAEAAVQYATEALGVARLTLFQTRYTNLIDYRPDAAGWHYIAQNIGRAKVQGLEGSWQGRVGATEIRMAATLQNPQDTVAQQDLNRRARRFMSVSAHRSIGSWRVGGDWFVSGPRIDTGTHLGGYALLNLSVRYALTKAWYASARIDNLLDKDYAQTYGYNTPRRGAYVTLGWHPL